MTRSQLETLASLLLDAKNSEDLSSAQRFVQVALNYVDRLSESAQEAPAAGVELPKIGEQYIRHALDCAYTDDDRNTYSITTVQVRVTLTNLKHQYTRYCELHQLRNPHEWTPVSKDGKKFFVSTEDKKPEVEREFPRVNHFIKQ